MLTEERHAKILQLLDQNGIVDNAGLVRQFGVSSETVRKDLQLLEGRKKLKRIHGGAVPVTGAQPVPGAVREYVPFSKRDLMNQAEKAKIAEKATEYVREEQSIALDYGSTSRQMARALCRKFRSLTVLTNSVQNAMILSEQPGFTVILTGGILQRDEYSLVNDFSSMLNHLHIDLLFLSVSGIDPVIGCTDQRMTEVTVQNQLRLAAGKTIVLADSSKFGKASLVKICSLKEVQAIITDDGLPEDMQQKISATGVNLVIA